MTLRELLGALERITDNTGETSNSELLDSDVYVLCNYIPETEPQLRNISTTMLCVYSNQKSDIINKIIIVPDMDTEQTPVNASKDKLLSYGIYSK